MHFVNSEFCLNTSTKWYNFKENCAGLAYEFAFSSQSKKLFWLWIQCLLLFLALPCFVVGKLNNPLKQEIKIHWTLKFFKGNMPLCMIDILLNQPKLCVPIAITANLMICGCSHQESLNTQLQYSYVLSHCFWHGTSTKNWLESYQTCRFCVQAVCFIVQFHRQNCHPLLEMSMFWK